MSRSTFKVLFYVNGSKEKDGIVLIMGREREQGERQGKGSKGTSTLYWTTSNP